MVPFASPTAVTLSPTDDAVGVGGDGLRPEAPLSCRTATSSFASAPTTLATYVFPVLITVALTLVAPPTTWWFVTTSPSDVSTMPVPAAFAPAYFMVVTMRTRPVSCFPDALEVESEPSRLRATALPRGCDAERVARQLALTAARRVDHPIPGCPGSARCPSRCCWCSAAWWHRTRCSSTRPAAVPTDVPGAQPDRPATTAVAATVAIMRRGPARCGCGGRQAGWAAGSA